MTDDSESTGGKGRPTPSRRDAEAARRAEMKRPLTRKEQAQRQRRARDEIRNKQRAAINAGEGDYLPARDRGPVRRFVRDYVDARWNFGEFLLPILLVILAMSIYASTGDAGSWAARMSNAFWAATVIVVAIDSWRLTRGVKKAVTDRFGAEHTKGVKFYALLRSTQLRRFRLPKAGVPRGGTPRS